MSRGDELESCAESRCDAIVRVEQAPLPKLYKGNELLFTTTGQYAESRLESHLGGNGEKTRPHRLHRMRSSSQERTASTLRHYAVKRSTEANMRRR